MPGKERSDGRSKCIVILGGGFAGVLAVCRLDCLCRHSRDVQITLISRDNFLLMTPLMFEACTGTLELRHCSAAIRAYLRKTRFIEGIVRSIDLEKKIVHADWGSSGEEPGHEIPYDQLVLARAPSPTRGRSLVRSPPCSSNHWPMSSSSAIT